MNPIRFVLEDCLPSTGSSTPLSGIILLAAVMILAGAATIFVMRRKRGAAAVGILAVVIAASAFAVGSPSPALAAPCPPSSTPSPTQTPTVEPLVAPDIVLEDYDFETSPGFYIFTVAMDSLGITTPNPGAVVDWASVDLQPDVPGIQHTANVPLSGFPGEFAALVYDPTTHVLTATANWSSSPGAWVGTYAVSDSLGGLSNTATIITSFPV